MMGRREVTNLFLRGPRHSGKTTAIFRALRSAGVPYGGYCVKRVYRPFLERFDMVDLIDGTRYPVVRFSSGGWVADEDGFIKVGVPAISESVSLGLVTVMDEVGVFERGIAPFERAVMAALDSPSLVVGVLKQGYTPMIGLIESREDVRIIEFRAEDRSFHEEEIRMFLSRRC